MNAHSTIACPCCGAPIVDDGRVVIDFEGGLIVAGGKVAALTAHEFELFAALWAVRPRVMTKEALLRAVHLEAGWDDREIKIVDVYVCKARKELTPLGIQIATVWGKGYRITTASSEAIDRASAEQPILGDTDA